MLSSPPKRPSLCKTWREGLDKGDFYFPQIYIFLIRSKKTILRIIYILI